MPGYTNISKPAGASYTNVSKPAGASYTNIAKPGKVSVIRRGMATGLIIPLTYAKEYIAGSQGLYVEVSKPT